jgi:hypothetical protein
MTHRMHGAVVVSNRSLFRVENKKNRVSPLDFFA